jgi:hypothetical protein
VLGSMVAGSLSAPSRRDRWGNRGLLVACAAVIVLVTAVIMNASQVPLPDLQPVTANAPVACPVPSSHL